MKDFAGEDFTLHSAAVARGCACAAHAPPSVGEPMTDALMVHTTIGITPERDGVLGAYTQYGAMVELTGLRLAHLPRDFVAGVRFVFAVRVGFGLAVRRAPFPA
ncbi:hypothetical protein [Erythrobacter oryzae]|uniref:hypothetical protein n=1 Tax=Erythrobacter oryzae TaxID=3019556 RepID=UPI0025575023|nr:hypothetical protein [Erythrobacter sp. COR-2]